MDKFKRLAVQRNAYKNNMALHTSKFVQKIDFMLSVLPQNKNSKKQNEGRPGDVGKFKVCS